MENQIRDEALRILDALANSKVEQTDLQRAMIEMDVLLIEYLKEVSARVRKIELYLQIPELERPDNGSQFPLS